jgi:nicotinamidase-related amidase
MPTTLLVIDLQNDYFPGGLHELVGAEQAAANVARLLEEFRRRRLPVVHVRHLAAADIGFFRPGTPGAEIHASVRPAAGEPVVDKHFPNSFRESPLLEVLRDAGAGRLVIAGAMSHMCVDATTRAAADLGFACSVAHDACATRDLEFGGRRVAAAEVHASFMAALGWGYGKVLLAREAIDDLG